MPMIAYLFPRINRDCTQQRMNSKPIETIFVRDLDRGYAVDVSLPLVVLETPSGTRFLTECVYLALHVSHLGLVATAKKPQRRNNIIRELNR